MTDSGWIIEKEDNESITFAKLEKIDFNDIDLKLKHIVQIFIEDNILKIAIGKCDVVNGKEDANPEFFPDSISIEELSSLINKAKKCLLKGD